MCRRPRASSARTTARGRCRPELLLLLVRRRVVGVRPAMHGDVDVGLAGQALGERLAAFGRDHRERQRHAVTCRHGQQAVERRGRRHRIVVAQPEIGGAAGIGKPVERVPQGLPGRMLASSTHRFGEDGVEPQRRGIERMLGEHDAARRRAHRTAPQGIARSEATAAAKAAASPSGASEPGRAVAHHFRHAGHPFGNHRQAGGLRLQIGQPIGLAAPRPDVEVAQRPVLRASLRAAVRPASRRSPGRTASAAWTSLRGRAVAHHGERPGPVDDARAALPRARDSCRACRPAASWQPRSARRGRAQRRQPMRRAQRR